MRAQEIRRRIVASVTDDLLRTFDVDARMHWVAPEAEREARVTGQGNLLLVRYIRPAPAMSSVLYSDLGSLDQTDLDALVASEVDDANRRGLAFSWTVYAHDQPKDLGETLRRHGFESDEDPEDLGPVMVHLVAEAAARVPQHFAVDVRSVGPDDLDDLIAVEERVWGGDFDWLRQRLRRHFEEPAFLSVHVAYVDGEPACGGWSYHHPTGRFVMLRGGATVPEHRNKGLYAAVLASRAREAARRGATHLVVEPSPMNVPIVTKFGFRELTRAQDFVLRS